MKTLAFKLLGLVLLLSAAGCCCHRSPCAPYGAFYGGGGACPGGNCNVAPPSAVPPGGTYVPQGAYLGSPTQSASTVYYPTQTATLEPLPTY